MASVGKNAPCPCGTGRTFKGCCLPVLDGEEAGSPEALMRSRYSAYATGRVAHILRTTHPRSPHLQADARSWAAELRAYCQVVQFTRLEVHEAAEEGDHGRVRFSAQFVHGGQAGVIAEHSSFERVNGAWLYLAGMN